MFEWGHFSAHPCANKQQAQRRRRSFDENILRNQNDEKLMTKNIISPEPPISTITTTSVSSQFTTYCKLLHQWARDNCANEIKEFAKNMHHADWGKANNNNPSHISESIFLEASLTEDENGNLPAMIAATYNNSQALNALLAPFMLLQVSSQQYEHVLSTLIHHENKHGQRLIALTSVHQSSLVVPHGIVIEMEGALHRWNSSEFKQCIRQSLGSSLAAQNSVKLFHQMNESGKNVNLFGKVILFAKTMISIFIFRSVFWVADILTDAILLHKYYNEWSREQLIVVPKGFSIDIDFVHGGCELDQCRKLIRNITEIGASSITTAIDQSFHTKVKNLPLHQLPLECYPSFISAKSRFLFTAIFILLPICLYACEFAANVNFDKQIKRKPRIQRSCTVRFGLALCDLFSKLLLLVFWPFFSFLHEFWFTFCYEILSQGEAKINS